MTQQNSKWTLCSDRLPDTDDCMLVTDGESYAVGFWRPDAQAWDSAEFGWIENRSEPPCGLGTVIAWRPLPEYFPDAVKGSQETYGPIKAEAIKDEDTKEHIRITLHGDSHDVHLSSAMLLYWQLQDVIGKSFGIFLR